MSSLPLPIHLLALPAMRHARCGGSGSVSGDGGEDDGNNCDDGSGGGNNFDIGIGIAVTTANECAALMGEERKQIAGEGGHANG